MSDIKAVEWLTDKLRIIDQTRLPKEEVYLDISDYRDVAEAIRLLKVRGAPAIGIAAAYGLALGAQGIRADSKDEFMADLRTISRFISETRPTAVNLSWALNRMNTVAEAGGGIDEIKAALVAEAKKIDAEDDRAEHTLGKHGSELIENGFRIMTH